MLLLRSPQFAQNCRYRLKRQAGDSLPHLKRVFDDLAERVLLKRGVSEGLACCFEREGRQLPGDIQPFAQEFPQSNYLLVK